MCDFRNTNLCVEPILLSPRGIVSMYRPCMTVPEQQRHLSSHSLMARAVPPIWLLGQLPKNLVSGSFMTLERGFSLHELIRSCYFSCYFLSLGLLCSHRQNVCSGSCCQVSLSLKAQRVSPGLVSESVRQSQWQQGRPRPGSRIQLVPSQVPWL